MKATMVELKRKARALAELSGYNLFKENIYFANDGYLKALESAIAQIISDGESAPDMRFTPTEFQVMRLNDWVTHLKQTYLMES